MVFHFFFSSRRRHTRFDCDWSSDVCSSDLRDGDRRDQGAGGTPVRQVRTALDVPRPSDGSVSARRVLAVLAVAELLAMAPWFSASAVAPTLSRAWQLTPADTAWLTISVQLGFVIGALLSAVFTLSDLWSARRLVQVSAVAAGGGAVRGARGPRSPVRHP